MKTRRSSCVLLLLATLLGTATTAVAQDEEEKEPYDLPRQRAEWFLQQRMWPLGYIPAGAHQRSIEQLRAMILAESAPAPRTSSVRGLTSQFVPQSLVWTNIGPQPANANSSTTRPVGGRVTSLAVDPTNANIIYQGAAQGGIWKSIDGGSNWTPISDFEVSLAIGSIALDPTNHNTVYVGTGENHFSSDSYYGAGVLKSTDAGAHWTQLGASSFVGSSFNSCSSRTTGGAKIGSIAVSSNNNQVVLAAVNIFGGSVSCGVDGIYRSIDGGQTWTNVLPGAPGNNVIFDPNGTTAYASVSGTSSQANAGIYKSTDSGTTWNALVNSGNLRTLPAGSTLGRIEIAMAPSNSQVLYATIADGSLGSTDILGMMFTIDGGNNWSAMQTVDYCAGQCWYDNVIRVQPGNSNVVFVGGSATLNDNSTRSILWRSVDQGQTWTEISSSTLHVDTHAIAFSNDGSKMFVGNDGGVWSTTTALSTPVTWTNLNTNVATLQVYPGMSIFAGDASVGLIGTQDNGTQKFSGGAMWQEVTCGDGGPTAIDSTGTTMYAACQQVEVRKSTQSGARNTFTKMVSGINPTGNDRIRFIPAFTMDPQNDSILYYGTQFLYQCKNPGDPIPTWAAISPELTNAGSGTISTISVAPNSSDTVYVGTGDGKVQVTTNATQASPTWTDRSAGLPGRAITSIAVDPSNAQIAYVGISGFTVSTNPAGHIFKTTNAGATWTDVTGSLESVKTPVTDLVIDPDYSNVLYAATDVGVFRTLDGGVTWNTLVSGLPRVAVLSLKLHRASRTLRAGTHGRSVWDLLVAPVAFASLSPVTFLPTMQNTTSAAQSVTITNTGNLPLVISAVNASSEFAVPANNCVATIAIGASCTMSVTFTPASGGTRNGAVTLSGNMMGGSSTISLTGTGIGALSLNLPSVALLNVGFGNVLLGSQASLPVTVTNNTGGALNISSVSNPGGDFGQTNNCPGSLPNGASCIITVTVRPSQMGARTGTITVSDGSGVQTLSLSGTGVDMVLSPSRSIRTGSDSGTPAPGPTTLVIARSTRPGRPLTADAVVTGAANLEVQLSSAAPAAVALSCLAPEGLECTVPVAPVIVNGESQIVDIAVAGKSGEQLRPGKQVLRLLAKAGGWMRELPVELDVAEAQSAGVPSALAECKDKKSGDSRPGKKQGDGKGGDIKCDRAEE